MAKKKPKKKVPKRSRATPNPTLFVLEGSIMHFPDGSMLELHGQITMKEWETIVEETIKYSIFLKCLKEIAIPLLEDEWTTEDDWFRIQLDVAVSRIRNIDPLLVAKHNVESFKKTYTDIMKKSAPTVLKLVEETRKQHRELLRERYRDQTIVTDL